MRGQSAGVGRTSAVAGWLAAAVAACAGLVPPAAARSAGAEVARGQFASAVAARVGTTTTARVGASTTARVGGTRSEVRPAPNGSPRPLAREGKLAGKAGSGARTRTTQRKRAKAKPTVTLPKPTGNAAAIAFYRKVVAATRGEDGVEQLYPPTAPLTQVLYSKKGLAWYVEEPKKAGYAPAADLVFIGASHGKVTFVADSVLYEGIGPVFPLFGLLLTAKGEVLLAGGAPASISPPGAKTPVQPCVGPTKTAFVAGYPAVGVPFGYALYGHFDAMKPADKGKVEEVTSTYPWPIRPVRTATEVDTVEVSNHLPVAGVIKVSAGGGMAGFSLRWANKWFKTRLYPPKTNGACVGYEKGLL